MWFGAGSPVTLDHATQRRNRQRRITRLGRQHGVIPFVDHMSLMSVTEVTFESVTACETAEYELHADTICLNVHRTEKSAQPSTRSR